MTRKRRIREVVICVLWAVLGIWALADANYLNGAIFFALSAAWLWLATSDLGERAKKTEAN